MLVATSFPLKINLARAYRSVGRPVDAEKMGRAASECATNEAQRKEAVRFLMGGE